VIFDALSGESVAAASLAAGGVAAADVASGFEAADFAPAACAALLSGAGAGVAADGIPDGPALSGLFSLMTICQARLYARTNEHGSIIRQRSMTGKPAHNWSHPLTPMFTQRYIASRRCDPACNESKRIGAKPEAKRQTHRSAAT
jgi:hypothetical protein